MQLCDADSLREILSLGKPHRESKPRMTRRVSSDAAYHATIATAVSRRCQCGNCLQCRENARWERIFQEKFADPNYYSRPMRRGSPLS